MHTETATSLCTQCQSEGIWEAGAEISETMLFCLAAKASQLV